MSFLKVEYIKGQPDTHWFEQDFETLLRPYNIDAVLRISNVLARIDDLKLSSSEMPSIYEQVKQHISKRKDIHKITEALEKYYDQISANINKSRSKRDILHANEQTHVDQRRLHSVLKEANKDIPVTQQNIEKSFNVLFPGDTRYTKTSTLLRDFVQVPHLNLAPGIIELDLDGVTYHVRDMIPIEYYEKIVNSDRALKQQIVNALYSQNPNKTHNYNQAKFIVKLNSILFNKRGGMSLHDHDNVDNVDNGYESSDDEEVQQLVEEFEPEYKLRGGSDNIKDYADEKIVSPYLLGAFTNGELGMSQVAMLKDRRNRRKLFKSIV